MNWLGALFGDNVTDDFLENGSDHHYGGRKSDAARYVVTSEGDKRPVGRWLRSGTGEVIRPGGRSPVEEEEDRILRDEL